MSTAQPVRPADSPEEMLFAAARAGDLETLERLLDERPVLLHARAAPYEWTLLHMAANHGHLPVVDSLLGRGLDPNVKERGDRTYPMHWAAAGGHVDVVRRLADAGGDVVGHGDDHELDVLGWATCWPGCQDSYHLEIAELLLQRGARHHIFSAIACNLAAEVRRIVVEDPSALSRRMSRNENHQTPLHFAVSMERREIVGVLLELGADPLATDDSGMPVAAYARTPDVDRAVMEVVRQMMLAELESAERGRRAPRVGPLDLLAALALGDVELAARVAREDPRVLDASAGALHIMAKRGDAGAVAWLLERGADPNGLWSHWGAQVTPLHLAALGGHAPVARRLLDAGADPSIRDSRHDGDASGWANFFGREDILAMLGGGAAASELHPGDAKA